MRLEPGTIVADKYRILRLIGDGGMGAVYEAHHERLGSAVALKFLHPELAKRPGLRERFLREARVSASIQSPHVTRVTDVDEVDGSAFIVMELLAGESLQQLLDRNLKLQADLALDLTLQILLGLEAAHAIGVVHRDLKPDNVFITPSPGGPFVKLLDFGIAKIRESTEYKKGLTRPGAIMGTPEYMAPEQAYAADQVDHRADLYSVGAMLYEMLSGERPADGDDAHAIVALVTQGRVRRLTDHEPSIPPGLADVVHRALDPVHTRRFASAAEMRSALAPFAGELSHAGRLAATATPAPPAAPRPSDAPPPATLDEPVLPVPTAEQAPLSAAATPASISGKGGTEDAPVQVHRDYGAPQTARHGSVPAPAPAPYYGAPQYGGPPPPPPARGGRAIGAILAVLLGALVTGGAIVFFVHRNRSGGDESPPPLFTSTPETTVSADVPTGARPPAVHPNTSDPPSGGPRPSTPGPTPQPTSRPRPIADAGSPTDAGRKTLPFPFPSAIPSAIPSSFIPPGLPSQLPFPIPTLQQPPKNDGTR